MLTIPRHALCELMQAGDLPVPDEADREFREKRPKAKTEDPPKPQRSSKRPAPDIPALRVSQQPMAPQMVPLSVENYAFLPVRSEDLGRLHFEFNPSLPASSPSYPEAGAAAWDLGHSPAHPQNISTPAAIPAQPNTSPPPTDGFLRTLAAMSGNGAEDLPQSVPPMAIPMDMSSGENMLGMWSSMSGNMQ